MPETIAIKPADLLIDEENPRLSQPNVGQHKAQQALAEHQQKKLERLAHDIQLYGLDPSSLPIVMPYGEGSNRYLVLEGNRRLLALKALENPDSLAEGLKPNILKQIRRISHAYQENPIETVQCVVVASRDEARHWMELRHTGLNEGAGLMDWGSDEAARFRARTGGLEIHSQALNFLEQLGALTPELRRKVPATSFKRLIGTPEVRAKLGVEVLDGKLYRLADKKRIAKAMMYVVNDLASGATKVGKIYLRPDRIKYADALPKEIVVTATTKSGHGEPIDSSSGSARPRGATTPRPRSRDKLIPRDCVLNTTDLRCRDIESELRRLSLTNSANAVSVLFRVFIELCADDYIERLKLPLTADDRLVTKLQIASHDLVTRNKLTKQQARPVNRAAAKDSFLAPSVNIFNDYVHNKNVFPAGGDLRAYWDSLQPFVVAMWAP